MLVRASRTSSTVAARKPPSGSSARKRLAVTSKLRWVCGELRDRSQDFSSASSDSARVALTSVISIGLGSVGGLRYRGHLLSATLSRPCAAVSRGAGLGSLP